MLVDLSSIFYKHEVQYFSGAPQHGMSRAEGFRPQKSRARNKVPRPFGTTREKKAMRQEQALRRMAHRATKKCFFLVLFLYT